jgi:hypothetical protein
MGKRTKQIDDSREIELPHLGKVNGKPVFTTVGQINMQANDIEEALENIKKQKEDSKLVNWARGIIMGGAQFANQMFQRVAPESVVEAEQLSGSDARMRDKFVGWMTQNQFTVVQDGIKTIVKANGKVVAEATAPVPDSLVSALEAEIKRQLRLLNAD